MTDKPTTAELSAAIVAEREAWIMAGTVADARAIGDGHCYDFAQAVMRRLGVAGHGAGYAPEDSHARLVDVVTEDWWTMVVDDDGDEEADPFHMDIPRLRREGAPLPSGIDDDTLAGLLGAMTHNWLVLDGRHHDATCPEGADHFLLMPFFANQLSGHLATQETTITSNTIRG